MELFDVVTKLIGPVQPVGETYADHARLENLKSLTELTERLLAEIRQAASCSDRHEASMSAVGKYAKSFLVDVMEEVIEQAHMAGQHAATGCDPSYSAAFAYRTSLMPANCAIEGPEQAQLANGPSRMES